MENTQTTSKTPKLKLDFKDSKYATGRRKTSIAKGIKSKVRDYGRIWDFGGKSAEVCPIDWKGSA